MASFKYLIFVALAVYAVSAEESNTSEDGVRVKKHAYVASVRAPVWGYSAPAPYYSHKPYTYPTHYSYPHKYPAVSYTSVQRSYPSYPHYIAKTYATYPTRYVAPPSYTHHGGKYWHGKYHH